MSAVLDKITLTADQQAAADAFYAFLTSPTEQIFVLSGYSGCGKSTLVRYLLDGMRQVISTVKLINPDFKELEVALTATTNKACEALHLLAGGEVTTIHSWLGLRVHTDYQNGKTTLTQKKKDETKDGYCLFIDEASFVDKDLLKHILTIAKGCKIVFIGDPAQLSPVKSNGTPVFDVGFNGAELREVVRQAEGNPIIDLSTNFRNTVITGEWTAFRPDGHHIQHMDQDTFNDLVAAEFTRPDWKYADSKVLAWTNKRVIEFNNYIRGLAKGQVEFQPDDYAVCNSFTQVEKASIKTDQMVHITHIGPEEHQHNVLGRYFEIDGKHRCFMPNSLELRNAALKEAKVIRNWSAVEEIESRWIDLRAAYACTINKAQGSTFDKVYIDLGDVARCTSGEQMARMLYVAVSRARTQVFLTGDLA